MNRLVSIEIAVNNAMGDMGMEDQRARPLFMRWAEDAERKIGSFYALKRKYFTLTMSSDCHRAALPCGVEAIMGIMYGNRSDCNCDAIFRNAYNYNRPATNFFLYPDGSYYNSDFRQWEIQDGNIVFMYPLTGVTEIVIDAAYRQMDSTGRFLMVPQEHIDAIGAYIKKMRAERARWLPAEIRMNGYDMQQLNSEWGREMRNARAQSSDPSPSEYAAIAAMINDPLSGWGGGVLRYPDEFKITWAGLC